MRTHTQEFKDGIKSYGRQFVEGLNITNNNGDVVYSVEPENINRIQYTTDTQLFKSVMQKITFDTTINLGITNRKINYYIGLSGIFTSIQFYGLNIEKKEEQKDSKSYLYTCYDNMIKTMVDYETPKVNGTAITYPITTRNYLSAICSHLGISFGSGSTNFTNYDKEIKKELYVDSDGHSLGYTFRDVLDDIAEATASFIYINNDGELKVKSIYNTNDTINEDYFKDKNVNVGEKVGAYNVVVLSRANDSDNLYYPQTLPQNPIEFKISDNLILEQDTREDFIQGIYNAVNGLEFYTNDFATNGILYYEIGDKFNVSIDGVTYPCLMLSDDIIRTTGLKENIRTTEPQQSVTPYKYASYSDKVAITSKNAKILVDKANASIEQIVEAVGDNGEVTTASIVQSINDSGSQIKLNADKVYINGVTFDENQNMTMTDGRITLEDDPDNDAHPTIEIKNTTLNNSSTEFWSQDIVTTERYTDYTDNNKHEEGIVLKHSIFSSDPNTFITRAIIGELKDFGNRVYGNLDGIVLRHDKNKNGTGNSSTSIEIWDYNQSNLPVVDIGNSIAKLKNVYVDQIFVSNSTANQKSTIVTQRTDTGKQIEFGVGASGVNRGIFDGNQNKWLFYTDDTNTYINSSGNTKIDNTIVDSIRTKNMFDKNTFVQGDITNGYPAIRISSRQNLWLNEGTYTFSTNQSNTYQYVVTIQNVGVPPLSSPPTWVYDSGWQSSSSKTFTISTGGYVCIYIRNANNTNINISEIQNFNYQLEKGSSATSYTPYQNLSPDVSDTGWVNVTINQGTWQYAQVRKIGKIVKFRARSNSFGRPSGTIFTIPSGYRPSQQESAYGEAGWVSAPTISRWYFNTDGTCGMDWNLSLVNGTDITENTWKKIEATWFID